MIDPSVIATARLSWQLVAMAPWLSRLLLRRAFPLNRCKTLLMVEMPGNNARFELLSIRPSAALTGLEARLYNALPFPVTFSPFRLTASISSTGLLNATLNSRLDVPAAGFARLPLQEIDLTDHQANWVRGLSAECPRIQLTLHWRCTSQIQDDWQDQGTFEFVVVVNKDRQS